MDKKWVTISTGFALFSMFFGSGNLVFPITAGQGSEGHYLIASLGFMLSGVLVPFMGVLGMVLYQGQISLFFSSFGKRGLFIFSLLALGLMGPFGVLARCLTVAHGALLLIIPNSSLPISSLIFSVVIYLLAVNKNRVVPFLGTYLTPLMILAIGAIAFVGLYQGSMAQITNINSFNSLKTGFFQGYQTMDLLAAFFFSQFVIAHLHKNMEKDSQNESMLPLFCRAACVGAGALSLVYFMLVLLGWAYSPILIDTPPQEMLGVIALSSLGNFAAPCLCIAIILACLTTAVVLASLFADFIQHDVSREKVGRIPSLIITLVIGFFVSTLDFGGIAAFLGPLLEIVYPALIVLTVVNIASKLLSVKTTHWPFTLTIAAKLSAAL